MAAGSEEKSYIANKRFSMGAGLRSGYEELEIFVFNRIVLLVKSRYTFLSVAFLSFPSSIHITQDIILVG